jgi:hypothetical protein
MEKSNHFRQAQVVAESVVGNTSAQSSGPGSIQFDIAAVYVPSGADTEDAAAPPGAKAAQVIPAPEAPVRQTPAAANTGQSADGMAPQNGTPNVRSAQSRPMRPGLRGH